LPVGLILQAEEIGRAVAELVGGIESEMEIDAGWLESGRDGNKLHVTGRYSGANV
jgi:hypothetical protein